MITVATLANFSLIAAAATINPNNYNYMMSFTPAAGKVSGNLSNFPILVRLSAARHQNFNPADCGENGANLRFALEDGTVLAHEIDTWNADGESLVWVNVPSLEGSTKITAYWGVKDAASAPTVNPADTWPDFVAVYHLGEGGTTANDSSGNNYTAVLSDGSASSGSSPKVGGCANVSGYFQTSETALATGVKPLTDWSKLTISAWISVDAWNAGGNDRENISLANKMSGDNNGGFHCRYFASSSTNQRKPVFALVRNSGSNGSPAKDNWTTPLDSASAGNWRYLTCTMDGSSGTHYVNGVSKGTHTFTGGGIAAPINQPPLKFGVANVSVSDGFAARMDELRIRNGAASAAWIAADYAQQNSSSFLDYGLVGGAFAIVPLSDMSVTPEQLLAGICPAVVVSNQVTGTELVLGKDYTVSYLDNTSFGIATAVATGINGYAGMTSSTSFRIDCVKNVSANYNLSADEDWSFVERVNVAQGVTIDLKGHRLAVSGLDGSGTITDSVGGGELAFIVPASYASGYSAQIQNVSLTGKLKLIKKGPGLLVCSKTNQSYTGGTEILGGVLRTNVTPGYGPTQLGTASVDSHARVYIGSEGTFDPYGSQGWGYHDFVVDGGAISNTYQNATQNPYVFNPSMTVHNNFTFVTTANYSWYFRKCAGHKVSVYIKSDATLGIYVDPNADTDSGILSVTGGGCLCTFTGRRALFKGVDLEFVDGYLSLAAEMSVRDYKVISTRNKGSGTATLSVYGTFTPESNYFYGPTMQDGSAIDLSSKTGAWSSTSSLGGVSVSKVTRFAAGAKVKIELGERNVKSGEKIIEWSQKPDSSVVFKNSKWNLEVRDDGLYVLGKKGFRIIVR